MLQENTSAACCGRGDQLGLSVYTQSFHQLTILNSFKEERFHTVCLNVLPLYSLLKTVGAAGNLIFNRTRFNLNGSGLSSKEKRNLGV